MLSIYLDQNMWIGIKEAVAGRPGGRRFVGLVDICDRAVGAGLCRFVLSYSHYEETHRRPQVRDREELATLMYSLSRGNTIALPQDIIRYEVRSALCEVLQIPHGQPAYSPFGFGIDHAVGSAVIGDSLDTIQVPIEYRTWATDLLELRALVGPDVDLRDLPRDHPTPTRKRNETYVEQREELAARMKLWSRDSDRADRFTRANEFVDLRSIINEVANPLGVSSTDLLGLGRDALERFMALLPMQSIVAYLHRTSLLSDRSWKLNDHNDVVYLASAAAYCDALIGEKHWTAKLQEPRCPTRAAHVLSAPEQLRTLIESL